MHLRRRLTPFSGLHRFFGLPVIFGGIILALISAPAWSLSWSPPSSSIGANTRRVDAGLRFGTADQASPQVVIVSR